MGEIPTVPPELAMFITMPGFLAERKARQLVKNERWYSKADGKREDEGREESTRGRWPQ